MFSGRLISVLLASLSASALTFPVSALARERICNPAEISEKISQLATMDQQQLEDFSDCGESSVALLEEALKNKNELALHYAIYVLNLIGAEAKNATDGLIEILLTHPDDEARSRAAQALRSIKPGDRKTVEALLQVFEQDPSIDVRKKSAMALSANNNGEVKVFDALLASVLGQEVDELRAISALALSEFLQKHPSALEFTDLNSVVDILEAPNQDDYLVIYSILVVGYAEAVDERSIRAIVKVLEDSDSLDSYLHAQASVALENIATKLFREAETLKIIGRNQKLVEEIQIALNQLDDNAVPEVKQAQMQVLGLLENDFPAKRQALFFQSAQRWVMGNRAVWILHPLVWMALVLAYPMSPQVQAFFFWNKHVRAILGCWYVGPMIAAIPPLRQRLFAPFKESLLADAKLELFEPNAYFRASEVCLKGTQQVQPLLEVLPAIKGQVVLEGESGLGKTVFLRYLVQKTQRITVFLPAQKCEHGVIEAIQAKLHGQAQDAEFLRHLIYSGALDICIDGLNEVRAEVRANITAFVESYFKGNIVMTTQPLVWNPPATAKTYVMQPLRAEQIQDFLLFRQRRLPESSVVQGQAYEQRCLTFLQKAFAPHQPQAESQSVRRILSNPMDLSVAAQIISQDRVPDVHQLAMQQYSLMAEDYERSWNQQFPLTAFSEFVYDMRVGDVYGMTGEPFYQALAIMEQPQHRMVVSRQWQDQAGEAHKEWSFRHDKIMEFFVVQTFLGTAAEKIDRRQQHLGDPRFRGIYFLLARLLPVEQALELREWLIHYAADTKDHTVCDDYVQILQSRQESTQLHPEPKR